MRHRHAAASGVGCAEVLTVRRETPAGRCLRFVFALDGAVSHNGGVWRPADGGHLNLHLPGTVRALLDAAVAAGHTFGEGPVAELDGWGFFDAVVEAPAPPKIT